MFETTGKNGCFVCSGDLWAAQYNVSSTTKLRYYTETLGFEKRSDNPMGEGMRWVTVAPRDSTVELVLQPPNWFQGEERAQRLARVGQSPTIVFRVDNCRETCAALRARGVKFVEEPTDTGWGVQAVFNDLYGNGFVLLERPF